MDINRKHAHIKNTTGKEREKKGYALLQKTFTEDVLTKRRIENDGSVPQYYVENSHEAIISKELYHEVQAEMARRSAMKDSNEYRRGYCSIYALTGVLVCGGCGAPFRRIVWHARNGKKIPVWRCRNRVEKRGAPCFAPTVHEDELQDAVVRAIRRAYGEDKSIMDEFWKNAMEVLNAEADLCDQRLQELQEELIRRVNTGESYDDLSDDIRELKEQRDKTLNRQAAQNDYLKHKQEVKEFLGQREKGGPRYKDSLVRKMITRIEVYKNRLIFTFKTGTEIEIKI